MQKFLDWMIEFVEESKIEIVLIHFTISAVLLVVVTRVLLKILRSFVPTIAQIRAMKIVKEYVCDSFIFSSNYSIKEDKSTLVDNDIERLKEKARENTRKIKILESGCKKLGYFSKRRKRIIQTRISQLEQANRDMFSEMKTLDKLKIRMKRYQELKKAGQGDVVSLGDIGWVVMQRNDDLMLLVSLRVVDVTYNRNGWAYGGLRQVCHSLYKNFYPEEKELVQAVKNKTLNENYITTDYVFVLSPEEFYSLPDVTWQSFDCRKTGKSLELFDITVDWRTAEWEQKANENLHDYVYDYENGSFISNGTIYNMGWWLRSSKEKCFYVDKDGRCHKDNIDLDVCGVRPAMYVKI